MWPLGLAYFIQNNALFYIMQHNAKTFILFYGSLSSIPFKEWAMICLLVHHLKTIWVVSSFWRLKRGCSNH